MKKCTNPKYMGEILLCTDVQDGDIVFVQLGGNGPTNAWAEIVGDIQKPDKAVCIPMMVRKYTKGKAQVGRQDREFSNMTQELAAELMQHVLDDMQERAQEGMLVLLDDDGNAHTVSPMQEESEQSDQPINARDKLAQQLRRAERWAQQQEGAS